MQSLVGAVKPVWRLHSISSKFNYLKDYSAVEHPRFSAFGFNLPTFYGFSIKKIINDSIHSPDWHMFHSLHKFFSLSSATSVSQEASNRGEKYQTKSRGGFVEGSAQWMLHTVSLEGNNKLPVCCCQQYEKLTEWCRRISLGFPSWPKMPQGRKVMPQSFLVGGSNAPLSSFCNRSARAGTLQWAAVTGDFQRRCFTTAVNPTELDSQGSSSQGTGVAPRIKFKRLDKTARHIMQILDKEAVEEVRAQREIPDIRPGYIVQLKVEVPENKRRVTTVKGIVIARRNAGLNTTFRLRRLVAGVGVESLFPLFSPNIKEIKVLDKKKVRRAKLYYLREKMNALKK